MNDWNPRQPRLMRQSVAAVATNQRANMSAVPARLGSYTHVSAGSAVHPSLSSQTGIGQQSGANEPSRSIPTS